MLSLVSGGESAQKQSQHAPPMMESYISDASSFDALSTPHFLPMAPSTIVDPQTLNDGNTSTEGAQDLTVDLSDNSEPEAIAQYVGEYELSDDAGEEESEEDATAGALVGFANSDNIVTPQSEAVSLRVSDSTVSTRQTRVKAPVDYKALADGTATAKRVVRQKKSPYNEQGVRVYCVCRMPDNGKFMINCDTCKDWYHGSCVGMSEKKAQALDSYECDMCKEVKQQVSRPGVTDVPTNSRRASPVAPIKGGVKKIGKSGAALVGGPHVKLVKNKRLCAIQGCANPSSSDSRFCSEACANKYDGAVDADFIPEQLEDELEDESYVDNLDDEDYKEDQPRRDSKKQPSGSATSSKRSSISGPILGSPRIIANAGKPTRVFIRKPTRHGSVTSLTSLSPAVSSPTPLTKLEMATSATPSPPPMPLSENAASQDWTKDKTRVAVRKAFGEVVTAIVKDLALVGLTSPAVALEKGELQAADFSMEEIPQEWIDVQQLAHEIEEEMFDLLADGEKGTSRFCGDKYKAKFRSLQFSLKDKKNTSLRLRLLSSQLTAHALVRLEVKDLANAENRALSEAIRERSLRDAMKPKEFEGLNYKKTHKGEEVISVVSSAGMEIDATEEKKTNKSDTTTSKDLQEKATTAALLKPVVPILKKSTAKSASVDKKSSASSVDILGDIMSKITKSGVSASSNEDSRGKRPYEAEESQKRHSDATYKRVRGDDDQDASFDLVYGDGSSWNSVTVADTYDAYDPSALTDTVDLNDDEPFNGEEGSRNGSDDASPSAIWNGLVRMPGVGKFQGSCRQVAGRPVGDGSVKVWESVLPPSISIEGRIPTKNVREYIAMQSQSTSKEVVVVEFSPNSRSPSPAENGEGGFSALAQYFLEKDRYAVVGHNYMSVKDMYLVPVAAGDPIPEMITVLPRCTVTYERRSESSMFGVIVLDKPFFNSVYTGATGTKRKAQHQVSSATRKRVSPPPPPVARESPVNNPANIPAATSAPMPFSAPSAVPQPAPSGALASLAALTSQTPNTAISTISGITGLTPAALMLLSQLRTPGAPAAAPAATPSPLQQPQTAQQQLALATLMAQLHQQQQVYGSSTATSSGFGNLYGSLGSSGSTANGSYSSSGR
ncbi:hypothetical protein DFJ73DRAFT_867789 [Zopfochytrium polystomum]|nr:hypothetical protein DFJ73DRAFT_867789 [Zopfochytrium polystomum]